MNAVNNSTSPVAREVARLRRLFGRGTTRRCEPGSRVGRRAGAVPRTTSKVSGSSSSTYARSRAAEPSVRRATRGTAAPLALCVWRRARARAVAEDVVGARDAADVVMPSPRNAPSRADEPTTPADYARLQRRSAASPPSPSATLGGRCATDERTVWRCSVARCRSRRRA